MVSAPMDPGQGLPTAGPGSLRRRIVFLSVSGALALCFLVLFRAILLPFLLAVVLAYVLAPVVRSIQELRFPGNKHLPRWASVLSLYLSLLICLGYGGWRSAPRMMAEIEALGREAPGWAESAKRTWLPKLETAVNRAVRPYLGTASSSASPKAGQESYGASHPSGMLFIRPVKEGGYVIDLPPKGIEIRQEGERAFRVTVPKPKKHAATTISSALTEVLRNATDNSEEHAMQVLKALRWVVSFVLTGIFTLAITLMISAYLLVTSDRIFAFLRTLVRPNRQKQFDHLLKRIDRGLAGVVRGQLMICLINGALSGIGFYFAGLKYWPILTLLATVLSIIPIFGAILSSVPAVLFGLQQGFSTAVFVLSWIVFVHQIEANFLNPKILGDSARVHPVLVVFALLGGERVFGVVGALLAVPVLSILQSLFMHYRQVALGVASSPLSVFPPPE